MKTKNVLLAILSVVVLLAVFIPLFRYTEVRRFHEDEHIFVRRGIFADYYLSGNFSDPVWQSFDSFDVPKFAELFYGVALRVYSGKTAEEYLRSFPKFLNEFTDPDIFWERSYARDYCCTIQDLPREIQQRLEPVLVMRKFSVFYSLFTLATLLAVCWRVKSWIWGVLSVVIIGTNILFKNSMVTAMGDGPLIFFSILYAFFICLFFTSYKTSNLRKTLAFFLAAGCCAGLATATKLNGVINLFHFTVVAQLYLGWMNDPFKVLRYQISFILVAFLTFFILNPFIWPNPLFRSNFMNVSRQVAIENQQKRATNTDEALYNVSTRVKRVYERTLSPEGLYTNFRENQIAGITGLGLCALGALYAYRVFRSPRPPFLERVKLFFQHLFIQEETKNQLELKIFLLWLFSWMLVTTALIPLDWDHYYLPIVIGISCLQSFAVVEIVRKVSLFLRAQSS